MIRIKSNTKILLAHVAWMEWYNGLSGIDINGNAWTDPPLGGGTHPAHDKHEVFNFREENGKCYGFVQPNNLKTKNTIIIENYKGVKPSDLFINDVLIVFFAPDYHGKKGGSVIVGYYMDAIVYRNIATNNSLSRIIPNGQVAGYNLECSAENAILLPVNERPQISVSNKRKQVLYNVDAVTDRDVLVDLIFRSIIQHSNEKDEDYQDDVRSKKQPLSQAEFDAASSRAPAFSSGKPPKAPIKKDARLGKEIIERKGYKCANCSSTETFTSRTTNNQYMEAHHLIPAIKENSDHYWQVFSFNIDSPENLIPLCPTCHRAVHYGTVSVQRSILETLLIKQEPGYSAKNVTVSITDLIKRY